MYALIENQTFVKWVDLHRDYPNTSFPSPITHDSLPEGVVEVILAQSPVLPTQFHTAELSVSPSFKEGNWVLEYNIREVSEPERQQLIESMSINIRRLRTEKLLETDWTQLPDSPVDKEAWAAYRQALRNITQQESFPANVIWPEKPV